jgi:hypothetical protein
MGKPTPKSSKPVGGNYHDAGSGKFVSKPFAAKNPDTTFRESTRSKGGKK